MTKTKQCFVCQECGYETIKWVGKCPDCNSWNTFVDKHQTRQNEQIIKTYSISETSGDYSKKYLTTIDEFDCVMGEGITRGSLTLIGGQPGVGKSTFILNVCEALLEQFYDSKALYVSGEETVHQLADRCRRIGITTDRLQLVHEKNWEKIVEVIKATRPTFLIIDSVQTTVTNESNSSAGSISQVKETTHEIMNYVKSYNLTTFIVGQITKDGNLAGPKLLEHMVDTVLSFESNGDDETRLLRATKNRFGSVDEVGLFEMTKRGLTEKKPKHVEKTTSKPGKTLTCIAEGKKPLVIEIQSLVTKNQIGNSKIISNGVEQNRIAMLMAVIAKNYNLTPAMYDLYMNAVGGYKVNSRLSDLSIISSILSSIYNFSIKSDVIFIGEVDLTGELRKSFNLIKKINQLSKLGYKKVYLPMENLKEYKEQIDIELVGVSNIIELKPLMCR